MVLHIYKSSIHTGESNRWDLESLVAGPNSVFMYVTLRNPFLLFGLLKSILKSIHLKIHPF